MKSTETLASVDTEYNRYYRRHDIPKARHYEDTTFSEAMLRALEIFTHLLATLTTQLALLPLVALGLIEDYSPQEGFNASIKTRRRCCVH